MSYRANLRRLKALTALVAVVPFTAATVVPQPLHGQDVPQKSRNKAQERATSGKRAVTVEPQPAKDLRGEAGNWTFSSQGGYESHAFPNWRKIKTQTGGPKIMGPRGRAKIMIDYWSPPGPAHGYSGTLIVERTGNTPGSFEARVLVDGKEVDSFKVEKETKRDLTKVFGSDLGGLASASNLRVTAKIGGTTYDIFSFDLQGAGEALQKMRIGPDEAWARNPNPAAIGGPQRKRTAVKVETKPKNSANCPPGAGSSAAFRKYPKQENGTLGSWSYQFFGPAAHADLIPEKIKTKGGGDLDGDVKTGGTAEYKIWYKAETGPKQGFNAWISVIPVGKYDVFKADLFVDGEKADSVVFQPEPDPKYKSKMNPPPYAKSFNLTELFDGDMSRVAAIRNLRVAADMDGSGFDVFDADLDGTADVIEKMKTDSDAHYAVTTARKACAPPKISGPGANPESQDESGGGRGGPKKCFITTACCDVVGLADDCFELTALRRFRDEVLAQTADGQREIRLYYELAPLVLAEMRRRGHEPRLLGLYFGRILPCVLAAELGLEVLTRRMYRDMMVALVSRYRPDRLASMI
ncbi:hypothetical protein AUC68_14220 [Methyloceanibacter methanicus]|uniref:Uncharacterized protein n=1 Tax=Methyloceanibacter methanicus TaxID=1774968 RepID=A0A1E3W4J6_9HYPH|nr:CFI-box-CTERM domain-containing protein [Methyloceanibacter methanicus]ODS00729.1 hypothetical protein AUC68_14220 [Methyloceanibacter methanicus]